MDIRWIGAALVVGSCSAAGFQTAARHRWETGLLKQIITAMDYMECQLQYRQTPLPELCAEVSGKTSGVLREIFKSLSLELEKCEASSAEKCMRAVLGKLEKLPQSVREILHSFGSTMGMFDLEGQVNGLKAVKRLCHKELDVCCENQEERIRSYKTLGICAGAGLVILFI